MAAVGTAVETGSWPIASFAVVTVTAFALLDGYHSWLYRAALDHARVLEEVWHEYHVSIGRGHGDPTLEDDALADLHSLRIGIFRCLPEFDWRRVSQVRPAAHFGFVYAIVVITAVAVLINAAL